MIVLMLLYCLSDGSAPASFDQSFINTSVVVGDITCVFCIGNEVDVVTRNPSCLS